MAENLENEKQNTAIVSSCTDTLVTVAFILWLLCKSEEHALFTQ